MAAPERSPWRQRYPLLWDVLKALSVAAAVGAGTWLAHKLIPDRLQDEAWVWTTADAAHSRGVWLVFLGATIAWPVYGLWRLVQRLRAPRPAPFEMYRSDELFGLLWRWSWTARGEVLYARAYCIECDLELDPQLIGYAAATQIAYHCTRCERADVILPAANRAVVEREVALRAEAEARRRGLLGA